MTSTSTTDVPDIIYILENFGLRASESKVFSALSELGISNVSAISQKSGVAREFVYQIMPRLVERGLIESMITFPKTFRAIPMEEAYKILRRQKREENKKLHLKALEAIKKHKAKKTASMINKAFETKLIPTRIAPDPRIGQEIQKVQESIEFTIPLGKFLQWSQCYADITVREVMKKGLKMRIITQRQVPKILATYPNIFTRSVRSKLKCIDFKYSEEPFSVEMMIFDKMTLFVSVTKQKDINRMTWLRTNNPYILEMANTCFKAMWNAAM
jgi:sugar-specific transcriptional regulator TrmB